MTSDTLCDLFQSRVSLSPAGEAYRQFDAARQVWVRYTWADMQAKVRNWRAALRAEALAPGARIAVLVPNSIEHVCMDQAALALGFVTVPLHVIDNPESLGYVIADSGAALLLIESASRWAMLAPFQAQFPGLRRVVYLGNSPDIPPTQMAISLEEWLRRPNGHRLEASSLSPVAADALATIVYTSGTTGRPKGVMLSHRNIVSNVNSILAAMRVQTDDVFLSFLPLSHTLERTAGYYLPIAAGASVAFARSVPQLPQDMQSIKPTVLISVPRIYERAHAALRETVEPHVFSRFLFAWAVRVGWRRFEHRQGRANRPSLCARVFWPVLDRLVGARVRARFGGRLRVAVTGGAAMAAEVAQPFLALGVPILQGYGMTESAPVIACNTLEDNEPASVGRALPGVAVRIGERDEILAHGDNVMMGYWQRPGDTATVLDPDGWLHTGDQGRLENGRVYIKGRIKDIIVTSTGEKIAPADLEAAIASDPLFEQVMVLGEGRPYLAALAVLNPQLWAREARVLGLGPDLADLHSAAATQWLSERIRQAVRSFPSYATPRVVWSSLEPWTVAGGLITPTLKPKRAAIAARFASEIAQLYRGH